MAKTLMKGNEALAAAAIAAGCKYFFGYPITPQSEVPEYFSRELPKVGGVYLQAESEVASINMVYGAAGAGARVMTSSSSPGMALMQEGISYIAGAELPCLIINMMRGGPGLGGIQPSQTDYYIATRGGGNGDYRLISFAPANLQEMVDLIGESFDIADKYRNPVMIIGDGMLGQMMEPVDIKTRDQKAIEKPWATTGTEEKRKPNIINSLYLDVEGLESHNKHLQEKYAEVTKNEVRYETQNLEGAEIVLCAYGTVSRICKSAMQQLADEGIKVGLIRPISIWPYPFQAFEEIDDTTKDLLVVEMNTGQMLDDVKIASHGRWPVHFYGRQGGAIPSIEEIVDEVKKIVGGTK